MRNVGHRWRLALSIAACAVLAGLALPAQGVTILDSTWREEGGTKGSPWKGFAAHLALAAQPQFDGLVSLSEDGEEWGLASGTWLGNDANHAYILTAAHVFELPAGPGDYVVRSPGGSVFRADRVWVHPEWDEDIETRSGYDLAIIRLTKPMTDAGQPPILYTGRGEAGKVITFVGFGSRGIGSRGERERFLRGTDKAAAQGLVEDWADLISPPPRGEDAGNYLGIFLPREDGSLENPLGSTSRPATRMVGLLGSGDSGGSAWMKVGETWMLVGVNSSGTEDGGYGETSWFARVAPHRRWISSIFSGARFATEEPSVTAAVDPVRPTPPPAPIKLHPDDTAGGADGDTGGTPVDRGFGAKFGPDDLHPLVHASEFHTPPNKNRADDNRNWTDDHRPPKPSKWLNKSEPPEAEAIRGSKW